MNCHNGLSWFILPSYVNTRIIWRARIVGIWNDTTHPKPIKSFWFDIWIKEKAAIFITGYITFQCNRITFLHTHNYKLLVNSTQALETISVDVKSSAISLLCVMARINE